MAPLSLPIITHGRNDRGNRFSHCLCASARRCSGRIDPSLFPQAHRGCDKGPAGFYDPVTEADRRAEETIRELIRTHYPQDGILGEEFGEVPGTSLYRWVLDPIDGTRAFIAGQPLWGTLIAPGTSRPCRARCSRSAFPARTPHWHGRSNAFFPRRRHIQIAHAVLSIACRCARWLFAPPHPNRFAAMDRTACAIWMCRGGKKALTFRAMRRIRAGRLIEEHPAHGTASDVPERSACPSGGRR